MDETGEVFYSPVIAGGEAPEVFEPAEAAFDAVTVLVVMEIHYFETADTSDRVSQVVKKFNPLGSKSRT